MRVEVLGPPPGAAGFTENEASLVLRLRYGETAFLFPGDLDRAGEAALRAALSRRIERASGLRDALWS